MFRIALTNIKCERDVLIDNCGKNITRFILYVLMLF